MSATTSSTCWTLIRGAAAGDRADQDRFARRYSPAILAYFEVRWRSTTAQCDAQDALQEVLFECLKDGGVLGRARPDHSFRGYLHGVTANVASRFEERLRRRATEPWTTSMEDAAVSPRTEAADSAFDRAWAAGVLAEARSAMEQRAASLGPAARRRVELLRLRFSEGRNLREIARAWDLPEHRINKDYAKAREEFALAMREAVAFYVEDASSIDAECRAILGLLRHKG